MMTTTMVILAGARMAAVSCLPPLQGSPVTPAVQHRCARSALPSAMALLRACYSSLLQSLADGQMRSWAWCTGGDGLGWGADSAGAAAAETLVAAPQKVERVAISYAQASKQVGVCGSRPPAPSVGSCL